MSSREHQSITVPLTVITVTYHSSRTAGETLRHNAAVLSGFAEKLQWIVIDNSEDGGDASFLSSVRSPNLSIVERPDNPGFAGACNLGATLTTSPWIMLLNPDVQLEAGKLREVIDQVLAAKNHRQTFAVGQVTDGVHHIGIGLLFNVWFTDRMRDDQHPPIAPSGGFGLYPRQLYLDTGGFAEELFAWGEDADLGLRFQDLGVPCQTIDVFFPHAGGHVHTENKRLERKKVWLLARNRQIIARRRYPLPRRVLFELMAGGVLLLKVPMHVRRGTLGAALLGNYDGLRNDVRIRRYAN